MRTPPAPDDLQNVFVYGTLRPRNVDGRIRPGWASECEVAPATPAHVRGNLYVGPGFPYATYEPDSDRLVRGDLLLCDSRHPAFRHLRRVELGAGYNERTVVVRLANGGSTEALMYVPDERSLRRWCQPDHRIHHGDWNAFDVDEWYEAYMRDRDTHYVRGGL